MCYMNNPDTNLLSLKMVFRYFKSQLLFPARRQTHFKSTFMAIGAKKKNSDNIFLGSLEFP